jgi:hypothetical protein
VADRTVAGYLTAVLVRVTVETGRVKSEKRSIRVYVISIRGQILTYEIRFVAVAALETAVLAYELVTGLVMIETVDPIWPVNELEAPSSVLAMAVVTFPLAGRRDPIVISLSAIYTHCNLFVTL